MKQIEDGKITQKKAAEALKLSNRQIRRLYRKYKEKGIKGIELFDIGAVPTQRLRFPAGEVGNPHRAIVARGGQPTTVWRKNDAVNVIIVRGNDPKLAAANVPQTHLVIVTGRGEGATIG